jgi:hypothetical protein
MSDETGPPVGEGGGLPPGVQAHHDRMNNPVWKARLVELEQDVHATVAALFAHAEGAAAISVPVQLADGTVRAVVAGEPIAVLAAVHADGPKILLNKHVIVGTVNTKELLLGAAMQVLAGLARRGTGPQDEDDEECACPACVLARTNPN